MRLEQWQESLIQAIDHRTSLEVDKTVFSQFVEPNQSVRLSIYRNNNLQGLMATLAERYELCKQILGDACFDQFAKRYSLRHPLNELNLNHYGALFSQYIEQEIVSLSHDNAAFIGFEYLGDLAQLEWCIHRAYYAPDRVSARPISDMARLSQTEQESIQFKLGPDVELLSSTYGVGELWFQLKEIAKIEQCPEFQDAGEGLHFMLVYRKHFHGHVCLLNPACYNLLQGIKQGLTLSQLMGAGLDMNQLGFAIESGWVIGFELNLDASKLSMSDGIQESVLGKGAYD